MPNAFQESDFIIRTASDTSETTVRVIELITDLVTKETRMALPVTKGIVGSDIHQDLIKVAAIDRTHRPGKIFTGFLKGFGLSSGALASSAAWDSSDIIVVGENSKDMAAAVNRVHVLQGGYVLWDNGGVIAEVPTPIFGLISDLSIQKLTKCISTLNQALNDRGVHFPDPLLTLITLTGAAIPFFRICEEGYVDLKDGSTLGLFVST
jgi:adenine deaminase